MKSGYLNNKDLIDDSKGNLCSLWKILGDLANFFPNKIVTDDEAINDPQKILEAFNIHFATIWCKNSKKY